MTDLDHRLATRALHHLDAALARLRSPSRIACGARYQMLTFDNVAASAIGEIIIMLQAN
jgi:hypothetical protein